MDPFLGEIRTFSWSWAPAEWALCDGTQLPVQQNMGLNALLGQTYGGNGSTLFALPDLRGRTPIGAGTGADGVFYKWGQAGGAEGVTLTAANMASHTHQVNALASSKGNSATAKSAIPAQVGLPAGKTGSVNIYVAYNGNPNKQLNPSSFSTEGGGAAHNNMQPFLVVNFCIATQGIFPPRP